MVKEFKIIAASFLLAAGVGVVASTGIHPSPANPVMIIPHDSDPITSEELAQRTTVCFGYLAGELEAAEIVESYKLETTRQRRDFELQCQLFFVGYKLGEADKTEKSPVDYSNLSV